MTTVEKRKSGIKARIATIATNIGRHGKDPASEDHAHAEGAVLGPEATKPKKSNQKTTKQQKNQTREERKKNVEESLSTFESGGEKYMEPQRPKGGHLFSPQKRISAMFKKKVKVMSAEIPGLDDDDESEIPRDPLSAPINEASEGHSPSRKQHHSYDDNATETGETLSTSTSTFFNSNNSLHAIAEDPEPTKRKHGVTRSKNREERTSKSPSRRRHRRVGLPDTGTSARGEVGDVDSPKSPEKSNRSSTRSSSRRPPSTPRADGALTRTPPSRRKARTRPVTRSQSGGSIRSTRTATTPGEDGESKTRGVIRAHSGGSIRSTRAATTTGDDGESKSRGVTRSHSGDSIRSTGTATTTGEDGESTRGHRRTQPGGSIRSTRSSTRSPGGRTSKSPRRRRNTSPRRSTSFQRKRLLLMEYMEENEMKLIIDKILRKYPRANCVTFGDHHQQALKVAREHFSQEDTILTPAKSAQMERILEEKLKLCLSEADMKHVLNHLEEEDEDQSVSIATPQESPGNNAGGSQTIKSVALCELSIASLSESKSSIGVDPHHPHHRSEPKELVHVQDLRVLDPSGTPGKFTGTICKVSRKPQGKGRLEYPGSSHQAYEGDWNQGFWSGYGKHEKANGDIYRGHFLDDIKHGLGVYRHADGQRVFDGRYVMGQRVDGSMNYADRSVYKGQWYSGKRHGRGVYKFSDGSTYKGEFQHDRIQGAGQLIWPDGAKYVGEWSQGKRHGVGKEFAADGLLRHEGVWRDGVPIDR